MNNKLKVILIALLAVLILVVAYFLYQYLKSQQKPSSGTTTTASQTTQTDASAETTTAADKAADFTVYDADGNTVHLSDYAGKKVIVNFWASWCGPCQSELPGFQAAYEKYGDEIQFLMVNLTGDSDTKADADAVVSQNGYTFPVFYDNDSSASKAYAIYSIPVTCFVSSDGTLVAQVLGSMEESDLQGYIDQLLAAK